MPRSAKSRLRWPRCPNPPIEASGNITDHVRAENDTVTLDIVISNTPISLNQRTEWDRDASHTDGITWQPAAAVLVYPRTSQRRLRLRPRLIVEGSSQKSLRDIAPLAGVGLNAGASGLGTTVVSALANVPIIPAVKPQWEAGIEVEREPLQSEMTTFQASKEFDRVVAVYDELRRLLRTGQIVDLVTSLRVYKDMVIESFQARRDAKIGDAFTGSLGLRQIQVVSSQSVKVTEPIEPRGQKQINKGKIPTTTATPEQAAAATKDNSSYAYKLLHGAP
jgi:hypothetical protein